MIHVLLGGVGMIDRAGQLDRVGAVVGDGGAEDLHDAGAADAARGGGRGPGRRGEYRGAVLVEVESG